MTDRERFDASALSGFEIAVLGYGSQGRAQALNLRDNGLDVRIGVRPGPSWEQAEDDGWEPREAPRAAEGADIIVSLVPDMVQADVFDESVAPALRPGSTLLFSHGFAIHYGQIDPPDEIDVVMVAPKAPGNLLRRQFTLGRGVPCLVAIHQDPFEQARERAFAYTDAIGGTRAGVIETTFAEETETDLFGEQAVLCGGVSELVVAGWETMVEAGYQPDVAYFECLHELKLIVDLMYEGGLADLHRYVSETATYGDVSRGPRVIDEHVRQTMRELLDEVRSGSFAREWISEHEAGRPTYESLLEADLAHPIEEVGARLRSNMSWLQEADADDAAPDQATGASSTPASSARASAAPASSGSSTTAPATGSGG